MLTNENAFKKDKIWTFIVKIPTVASISLVLFSYLLCNCVSWQIRGGPSWAWYWANFYLLNTRPWLWSSSSSNFAGAQGDGHCQLQLSQMIVLKYQDKHYQLCVQSSSSSWNYFKLLQTHLGQIKKKMDYWWSSATLVYLDTSNLRILKVGMTKTLHHGDKRWVQYIFWQRDIDRWHESSLAWWR